MANHYQKSIFRIAVVTVVGSLISCASRNGARPSETKAEPASGAAGRLSPADPAVQQYVMQRYEIIDPGIQQLVRGLMSKRYPERLSTARDIEAAAADASQIDIRDLPLRDYPLLKKFAHVWEIDLDSRKPIATDRHLEALASLGLREVVCITANNCSAITDHGIVALSRIHSVRQLGLEGTSITDKACDTMAHAMHITGLNVANCSGISFAGLKVLAGSETLSDVEFSVDGLTEEQVFELLDAFKNVKRCELVDLDGRFDPQRLVARGERRKIQVFVRRTGSLQDTWRATD